MNKYFFELKIFFCFVICCNIHLSSFAQDGYPNCFACDEEPEFVGEEDDDGIDYGVFVNPADHWMGDTDTIKHPKVLRNVAVRYTNKAVAYLKLEALSPG